MKKKEIKSIIAPLTSVVALGIGSYFGIENTMELKDGLAALLTGLVTVLAAFGVFKNNDKKEQ